MAKRSHLPIWLSLLLWLFVALLALISSGTLAAVVAVINSRDPTKLPALLFATLLLLSVLVLVYISIVGLRLKGDLDFQRIAPLPIKRRSFFLTETLSLYFDSWALFLFASLILLIVSLGLAAGVASLLTAFLLICCYVVFMGAFNQFYIYLLHYLFQLKSKRWLQKLLFLLSFALGAGLIFSTLLLFSKNPLESIDAIGRLLENKFVKYATPFGLVTDGISQLLTSQNFMRLYYLHLPILLVYSALFLTVGYQMLRLSEHLKDSRGEAFSINLVSILDGLVQRLWKKNRSSVTLWAKEVAYLVRSNRVLLLVLVTLLYVVFRVGFLQQRQPLHDFELLATLMLPVLIFTAEASLLFFFDGEATRAYFFNPISCRAFITAKNLAFLTVLLLDFLLMFAIMKFLSGAGINAWLFTASLLLVLYLFFALTTVSNYLAATNPKKVPYRSLFANTHTGSANAIKVISVFASVIPVIICVVLFQQSPTAIGAGLSVLTICSIIIYRITLSGVSRKLVENQERFLATLT